MRFRDRLLALRDWALGLGEDVISDAVLFRVVKARNNLTHSSTRDLARLEGGTDLYYLAQYVISLLRACFLIELGLTQSQVAALLKSSDQFSWLRRASSPEVAEPESSAPGSS